MFWRAVRAMFPAICFYTSVSSVIVPSPNAFTAIFLDSAWMFLTLLSMFWSGLSVGVSCFLLICVYLLSLSLHDEHLNSLVLDVLGGGEGCVSSAMLSTASSSDSSLDYTFTEIFLDSACLFSMMMMMRVLSIVVVSVLPPTVELLELVPCNHLVSLVLDVLGGGGGVVSSVSLSTASSSVLSLSMTPCELVGDLVLDNVGPSVGGQLVLGVQVCLDGLLNLVLLGNFHVNFVLDNFDPIVDC
jgi:hypothetical protein